MFVKSNPQGLRRIFESGERSLDGILAQVYARGSEEEKRIQEEQPQESIDEEASAMINEFGEIIRPNNKKQIEDFWQSWQETQIGPQSTNVKIQEQHQPEKIKPREESIRDEVGDKKDIESNMQIKEREAPVVDLWMNRFNNWYSVIDRVSQNVKAKFVEMKSDIVKAISNKLKERANEKEIDTVKEEQEK